jgi:hypothetical protein
MRVCRLGPTEPAGGRVTLTAHSGRTFSPGGLADCGDDGRRARIEDLIGDFTPMHLDFSREFEGDANAITLHTGYSHDSQRIARVTDHDFFPLSTRDHEHFEDLLSLS